MRIIMHKVQKMVITSRPKTVVYSSFAVVICCGLVFIANQTGSSLHMGLYSQHIYDQENSTDGEHASMENAKEFERYYSRLCKLDR